MAGFLTDTVLDQALNYIDTNTTTLHLVLSSLGHSPINWTEVNANSLETDATVAVGAPAAGDTSGRKVTVAQTSGTASGGGGTVGYWALTNGTNTMYASGALSATKAIVDSDDWTLPAFDIEIADGS